MEALDRISSLGRSQFHSGWALLLALGILACNSFLLLVLPPYLFVAAGLAIAVVLLLIVHPRAYLAFYLATGGLSLAIFASQPRELLQSYGGMEPDGLRLLAFTLGALLLLFVRPHLFLLLGRHRLGIAFILVLAASLLYSASLVEGIRLLLKICFPLMIYILVISEVRTEAHIRGLLRACLVGIGCVGLVAVLRVASGDSLYVDDAGGIPRFQGPMGASTLSFYSTCFAVFLYSFGTMRGRTNWPSLLGAISMAAAVAATGTRVGVAGLLLAVAAVECVRKRLGRGVVIGAGGLTAIAILSSVFQRFAYSRNINDLAGLSFGGGFWSTIAAIDTSGRDVLWRRVWEDLVMTSPVFGHGLGSANGYLTILFGRAMVPHSELLRLLADAGVVGAGLGVWLAVVMGRKLLKTTLPLDDRYEFLGPLGVGSFAAFLVFSSTDNPLEYYSVFTGYVAAFGGLLHVRARQLARQTDGA